MKQSHRINIEKLGSVSYNPVMEIKLILPINLEPIADLDLASFCKETREILGMTKKDMAKWLGVEYATYDNYEHNRRQPDSQVIAKLFLIREQLIKAFPLSNTPIRPNQQNSSEK